MNPSNKNEFRLFAEEQNSLLKALWQNDPMDEARFIKFAKDRGITVHGHLRGDPGHFYRRGWLPCDDLNHHGTPMFHSFRFHTLHRIIEKCRMQISEDKIAVYASEWNRIIDLAVLLEPIFWPQITGWEFYKMPMTENDYLDYYNEYHPLAMRFVKTLDPEEWRKHHEHLRHDAFFLDENTDLYVLLRLSRWDRRKTLKGRIAGALWIRHIAEVIRKAFESCHSVEWPEEDQAFGEWVGDSRLVVYGSYRPIDSEADSRPNVAFRYGLYTGSAVRWYVEGETEYFAVFEAIGKPEDYGIEVKNLRGNLKHKGSLSLAFQDELRSDIKSKRFSIVSFDMDRGDTVRAIQAQIRQNSIVGFIAAHKPDFEFSNFTLEELVELAARLDEQEKYSGDPLRMASWSGVRRMNEFEQKYNEVSSRQPRAFQKGGQWGRILAKHAIDHPRRPDTNKTRLFIKSIQEATWARRSHYDTVRQYFRIDPDTFERKENTEHER